MHKRPDDLAQLEPTAQRNWMKPCLLNWFLIRCGFFVCAIVLAILCISFSKRSAPSRSNLDDGILIDYSSLSDKYDICTVPPLTYINEESHLDYHMNAVYEKKYSLHINRSVAPYYFNGAERFYCCYSVESTVDTAIPFMTDGKSDKDFSKKCRIFEDQVHFDNEDAVLVVCRSLFDGPIDIQLAEYKNIHFIQLQEKDMMMNNKYLTVKSFPSSSEKLNFLMIGFDGNASSNIIDKMPKTNQFLKENRFIKLETFGKISSNVRSNDLALTSGVNIFFGQLICSNGTYKSEKYCPLFNNEYRDLGYIQDKVIFQMPYYKSFFSSSDTCRGPSFSVSSVFKYILNFVKTRNMFQFKPLSVAFNRFANIFPEKSRLKSDFLSASVYWLMNITDEEMKYTQYIDTQILQNFNEFLQVGVFNNTVVIFVSFNDDRSIGDELRRNAEGSKSHIYLSFPQWFRRKYPQDIENLESNAKQLTSPYDVYLTVLDVIRKTSSKSLKELFLPYRKCTSLFQVINNRTCDEIGIPLTFCPLTSD